MIFFKERCWYRVRRMFMGEFDFGVRRGFKERLILLRLGA